MRLWVALLLVAVSRGAVAQERSGDPAAGRLVALRSCAACHSIAARDVWYTQYARGFPEIARNPDLTEAAIARFLGRTHWMFWPGPELSAQEIADVNAYIASLGRP